MGEERVLKWLSPIFFGTLMRTRLDQHRVLLKVPSSTEQEREALKMLNNKRDL